jgi:AraC-like DNA-binding protein
MNLKVEVLKDNLRIVHKSYSSKKEGNGSDISGPFWMLIKLHVLSGRVKWKVDGEFIDPNASTVWLYLPPFSWTIEYYEKNTSVKLAGIIDKGTEPKGAPSVPSLFLFDGSFPKSRNDLDFIFSNAKILADVSLCTNPSSTATKIKSLFDNNFREGISMAQIASKLKTSQAVCSRQFKKSYSFTPGFYKKGLRTTVGAYSLLMGLSPAEAADYAGYNDLSRFYKQFSEYMKVTPDEHREKSKNAKT